MTKREASKAARRYESYTVGFTEDGEYVVAPHSETFAEDGVVYVKAIEHPAPPRKPKAKKPAEPVRKNLKR